MSERITGAPSDEASDHDRTDWERVRTMTDAENEANIASDFDSWPLEDQARGCFFHIFKGADGRWRWRLVDKNSEVLAVSGRDFADWGEAESDTGRLSAKLLAA